MCGAVLVVAGTTNAAMNLFKGHTKVAAHGDTVHFNHQSIHS